MPSSWTVDPNTLAALRLVEAEKAFEQGDLDRALIEAEELLDEHPIHPRALDLVAHSALEMGDVMMALEALNRLIEHHTPTARILHAVAVARFQAVDFPGALEAAEQATALDPLQTPSWYYQGLALERLGKQTQANGHFETAAKQDPEHFPLIQNWDEIPWDHLLESALDLLPQPFQVFLDGVPIRFTAFPAVEELLESYPPLSPFTDGLYRGEPPTNGDPWVNRPSHVTLFQANLARPSLEHAELITRISGALKHEAMHWLGIVEPEMAE